MGMVRETVRRDTVAVGVLPAMDTIEPADPLIEAIRSQSWR
jgi:hypothetical protein